MLKIFIGENVPSLNKGEMTILDGMLESFRTLGEVRLSMLSARAEIDALRYISKVSVVDISESWPLDGGLDSSKWGKILASILVMMLHLVFILTYKVFGMAVLSLFKSGVWKEYLAADVIIVGHNGTFGIGGSLGIPYFYPVYLPIIAKMLEKPIVLYGGGFGLGRGLFSPILNTSLKLSLKHINLTTLRERITYKNLKAIGIQGKHILVTADPAFLLQPAPSERIEEIIRQEGIKKSLKPLIGITVTRKRASMAFPHLNSLSASYNKHIEVMATAVDNLTASLGATVVFIPHCIGFGEELDDRLVAKDIFQICKNKKNVKLITNEYSAAELKGLIGQFDLFIGERLHSVVNAMSMVVPSVVVCNSTDQRLDIIRMFGQDDAVCFAENLDSKTLLDKIYDIFSRRDNIKGELRKQTEFTREKAMLNGKLLKELLFLESA